MMVMEMTYVGSIFGKTPLQVLAGIGGACPAGVLAGSQLCLGVRWCLVLVVCP